MASVPGYLWPKPFAGDEYNCPFGFGIIKYMLKAVEVWGLACD